MLVEEEKEMEARYRDRSQQTLTIGLAKVEVGQMANGDTPHRFLRLNALFKRSHDAKPAETGGESVSLPSHQAHALSCLSKGTTVQRIRGRHARHASVLSLPRSVPFYLPNPIRWDPYL
jgi:hypothetical protein